MSLSGAAVETGSSIVGHGKRPLTWVAMICALRFHGRLMQCSEEVFLFIITTLVRRIHGSLCRWCNKTCGLAGSVSRSFTVGSYVRSRNNCGLPRARDTALSMTKKQSRIRSPTKAGKTWYEMFEIKQKLEDDETGASATWESSHYWTGDLDMLSGSPAEEENTMDEEDNVFASDVASYVKQKVRADTSVRTAIHEITDSLRDRWDT